VAKFAVTGSSGLIGRELVKQLKDQNHDLVEIDIELDKERHDIANHQAVTDLTSGCNGIIHLPWVIHASSREVYGNQPRQAITEDTPMTPLNIYGRSKAAGEAMVYGAQDAGANVSILRFANVYGDILVDVAQGVVKVVDLLQSGEQNIPPIHFATGQGTTLGELARMAVAASNNTCDLNEVEKREASVSCFIGDPERARSLLGWTHKTPLQTGFSQMVEAFKKASN